MPATANGLPYPGPGDPPDVPTDLRKLAEAVDPLVPAHVLLARSVTNQLIPTGVATPLLLPLVDANIGGIILGGDGKMTVPVAGIYDFDANIYWHLLDGGVRVLSWKPWGQLGSSASLSYVSQVARDGLDVAQQSSGRVKLAAGATLGCYVIHTQAGSLNVAAATIPTRISLTLVRATP